MPSGCSRWIAKERSPSGTLERITGYLKQEVLGRLCSEGFLEHSEDENNALAGVFVDQLMDLDMEVHHHEAGAPVTTRSTMVDSLPGLGS
jgi:hypothetical protein